MSLKETMRTINRNCQRLPISTSGPSIPGSVFMIGLFRGTVPKLSLSCPVSFQNADLIEYLTCKNDALSQSSNARSVLVRPDSRSCNVGEAKMAPTLLHAWSTSWPQQTRNCILVQEALGGAFGYSRLVGGHFSHADFLDRQVGDTHHIKYTCHDLHKGLHRSDQPFPYQLEPHEHCG
jgi:hypothetical protein